MKSQASFAGIGDEVSTAVVDANDVAAIEKQNKAHAVKACRWALRVAAEDVEIGPAGDYVLD